jgi:tetratricopeptide (TPR) repeat protein
VSGEDDRKERGSTQVSSPKNAPKRNGDIVVTATPVEDEAELEAREGPDELDAEAEREEEGPLTIGEIVDGASKVLDDVTTSARRMFDRGRYRKIRISRKGKQVLPDIPLAAAAAIEAASIYGAGLARVLAVNVGAKFLFDVEVVNEADKYFERGKQAVLDGDLERALEAFTKAIRIDDTHAGAFLQLGVLFRLRGEAEKARPMLVRARELDENGEVGRRAEEILRALESAEGR